MRDLKAIRVIDGTKVSHDYMGADVTTYSYHELWSKGVTSIGIPCRQNRLVVFDVDVADGVNHKHDGRELWAKTCAEAHMPQTYTVRSRNGGFHFYYFLPAGLNEDVFHPPGKLGDGIEVKWNGWVGAPPSQGYSVHWGNLNNIVELPPSMFSLFERIKAGTAGEISGKSYANEALSLSTPYTNAQIAELQEKLKWMQQNATLTRDEWRDGLFALKAGVDDEALLEELVFKWTHNLSYVSGDENEAMAIVNRAAKHGGIGPGTIFAIIDRVMKLSSTPTNYSPFTVQEILDRAKVKHYVDPKTGTLRIEGSDSNASSLIGAIFDEKILYYDSRMQLYIYDGKSYSDTELVNLFIPMIQSHVVGLGLDKFKRSTISSGLAVLMSSRQRDPHKEYLKSLIWDGKPRVEKFFSYYVGAEDSEYTRLVGKNFWTALAARGLTPGCKYDSMVVLEGHEGIYKSSLVEAIGGEYIYSPTKKDSFDNLDVLRQMHQSVIVELPELVGFIGQTDEMIKGFLSKPFDHIRGLFDKQAVKKLRGFILVGTTNTSKYLAHAMGVRRFLPIKIQAHVKEINLAGIKADRDQLFAEGIALYKDKHPFWTVPEELLKPIVESRVMDEPLTYPIAEMKESLGPFFSTAEVYTRLELGGFIPRGMNNAVIKRIESAIIRLGYVKSSSGKWTNKSDVLISDFQNVLTSMMSMNDLI